VYLVSHRCGERSNNSTKYPLASVMLDRYLEFRPGLTNDKGREEQEARLDPGTPPLSSKKRGCRNNGKSTAIMGIGGK